MNNFSLQILSVWLCCIFLASCPLHGEVTVTGGDGLISVYVSNLDRLRERHEKLEAEIQIGKSGKTEIIDLKPEAQPPAILIEGSLPQHISVQVLADGKTVEKFNGEVKSTSPSPGIALTKELAFVESGNGVATKLPPIRQPDLNALPPIVSNKASRVIAWPKTKKQVQSDINYPSIGSNNLCALSRQTAHPDDPGRRSAYISMQSVLYADSKGTSPSNINYLAEIPLDPKWLEGTGDKTILLGARDVKIHATTQRWPNNDPKGAWITGTGKGALGQSVGSMAVDDNGDIYYTVLNSNYLVRFNIHTASFEAPPISLADLMNQHLPREEELPEQLRGQIQIFDHIATCGTGGGRVFLLPYRYTSHGAGRLNNGVYASNGGTIHNGVFSLPTEHWQDPEKFRAGIRILAQGWPGSDISLFDYWTEKGRKSAAIIPGKLHAGSYYMDSYPPTAPGGSWRIELNDDGSSRRVIPVTADEFKKVVSAETPRFPPSAPFKWQDYGILTGDRKQFSKAIHGATPEDDSLPDGILTIYYDAISAMRAQPERIATLLTSMNGPSTAPSYMLAGIPDEPGLLMGACESGYYLATYDVSKAGETGIVTKRYLQRDVGKNSDISLPVKAGLGPYGQLWWRNGRELYLILTGYSGVASMLYRNGDTPLERFVCYAGIPPSKGLDGSSPGRMLYARYPVLGMDNRVYLLVECSADRGATAFCSGLGVFTPPLPESIGRLAWMSRARSTGFIVTRAIHQGDGSLQQFIVAGNMPTPPLVTSLPEADRPNNMDGQMYFYQVKTGEEPSSVMGISLPATEKDGKREARMIRQVLSRDRRYLVSLQHGGRLLSFDLNTWQYADGYAIDEKDIWFSNLPSTCFIQSPDDRTFVCLQNPESNIAVFYELEVSPDGKLSLKPHLTLEAEEATQFKGVNSGTFAFTGDSSRDGSYDLCIAPNWRGVSSHMWVIPDFIAPRR